MMARLLLEARVLLIAVQFLTRLPVPRWIGHEAGLFDQSVRHFPSVGVLVGVIGAGAFWLSDMVFPQSIAALVSTAVTLLVTGAFHEDGFADCCDGLGGGATKERALEIMKDSRLGTYGVIGISLMLAAKIGALASTPAGLVPVMLIAAHGVSRASAVLALATSAYVREAGIAKPVAGRIEAGGLVMALLIGAAPATFMGAAGLAGVVGAALGHCAMRAFYERKLGGYTGDCIGGVQQTSELGFLLGALACLAF